MSGNSTGLLSCRSGCLVFAGLLVGCSSVPWPDTGAPPLWKPTGSCSAGSVVPQTLACQRVTIKPELLRSQPSALSLALPKSGVAVVRRSTTAIEGSAGTTGWMGIGDGDPSSRVDLAVIGESVSGRVVTSDGRLYRLRATRDDGPIVERLDPKALPPESPPLLPRLPSTYEYETRPPLERRPVPDDGIGPIAPLCGLPGSAVICVLVVYTPAAATAYEKEEDLLAAIEAEIRVTNLSYENSRVRQRLVLAAARKVAYVEEGNETNGQDPDLLCLVFGCSQEMKDVHAWRDDVDADVVVLITNYETLGSVSWDQFGAADVGNDRFAWKAFAIVPHRVLVTTSYSLTHELGHLMGAAHDPMSMGDFAPGPFCFSHGHEDPAAPVQSPVNGEACGPWMTVMSGGTLCPDCQVKLYWSSGDDTVTDACGRPTGNPYTEDNAKTLNETASTIAAFR